MQKRRSQSAGHSSTRVWPVVLAAVIITAAALTVVFGKDAMQYFRAKDKQNELQDLYRGAQTGSAWNVILPRAFAEELPAVPPEQETAIHEDFAALYEQNPHVVGWLSAGVTIDYPVVQSDNEFYLDHDYFGEPDSNGTLFINAANRFEPRDSILLIHGHNMKSGAMFGDLDNFRGYSYLSEHPVVTFRTIWDDEDVYYVPVAAFDASMNPGAEGYFNIGRIRFDFDLPADADSDARSSGLEEYIAQLRELSFWDSPVEADSTDEFIALVTCSYSHDDGRLVLVCRRLRDGETADDIRGQFAAE